jgi:hypothetical protein
VELRPKSWAGKLCGIKIGPFLFLLLAFSSFPSELDSWCSQNEHVEAIGKKRLNGWARHARFITSSGKEGKWRQGESERATKGTDSRHWVNEDH